MIAALLQAEVILHGWFMDFNTHSQLETEIAHKISKCGGPN